MWYKEALMLKEASAKYAAYDIYVMPFTLVSSKTFYRKTAGIKKTDKEGKTVVDEEVLQSIKLGAAAQESVDMIKDYIKSHYDIKHIVREWQQISVNSSLSTEDKIKGMHRIRLTYPIPDGLTQSAKKSWEELLLVTETKESREGEKVVIDAQDVYEQIIEPALNAQRNNRDILFIYSKLSFKKILINNGSIKEPYEKLRDSLTIKVERFYNENSQKFNKRKVITEPYDKEALAMVIDALLKYNDLKISELQKKSLYEISDSTKQSRSFHEFIIRDIFAICGLNFEVEVPFVLVDKDYYTNNPVIDFRFSSGDLFEIFGFNNEDYLLRKKEKIEKLPNLWYIDYASGMSKVGLENRLLTSYCQSLNNECYYKKEESPRALMGNDYIATLTERVPLLGLSNIELLNFYWQWTMNLPEDYLRQMRSKIKEIQQSPEYQPIKMQVTSQYKFENYILPSMKDIYSKLLSGEVATGARGYNFSDGEGGFSKIVLDNLSGQELIALYFQSPEVILPYLQQISNQLDNKLVNTQDDIEPIDIKDNSIEYNANQTQEIKSPENNQITPNFIPKAAKSSRMIKTAKIEIKEDEFNKEIKEFIKSSPFFEKLFSIYEVPIDAVGKNLNFYIVDLDGRHAKSKDDDIYINSKLLDSVDSLNDILHFIVHEITHWLTRQREKMCYFSDPEELEAFSLGIAFEMARGKSKEEIEKVYYPIILAHFKEEEQARKMFIEFLKSAKILNKNIFT